MSSKSARRVAVVISLIVGLMFGSQFNANWSEILLMFNAQSFGTTDRNSALTIGFYSIRVAWFEVDYVGGVAAVACRHYLLHRHACDDGWHSHHHASAWSWTVPHHQACA